MSTDEKKASVLEANEPREGLLANQRAAHVTQKLAALGEMTAGIAHDFRNILAVIEAGLRVAERSQDSERRAAGLAAVRDGIDRGTRLTNELLAFAKQQELGVQTGDANELLKALGPFLKHAAGPSIQINLKLAPDLPKCVIDRSHFGTALLNLVVNARDAMPRGGEIEISSDRPAMDGADAPGSGNYVRVRVKDCGEGMPPDVLRNVLDPFFTTKGVKGTGLGLPQVREFIRKIGGQLNIASEPGKGTTVDLLFPAQETRDKSSTSEARRPAPS